MSALVALAVAYAQEHPIEVARLLEGADGASGAALLEVLALDTAAAVLSEAAPRAAAAALAELPGDRAAELVAQLDPFAAAVVLMRLPESSARPLLERVPEARRAQLQTLLEYGPARAGGRADPRALAIPQSLTAAEALQWFLRAPEGALHYVYVLGDHQQLEGVVNLRELLAAPSAAALESIMVRKPERLHADDPLDRIARHPAWRRVHALPVVDGQGRFVGALRYSAFRRIEAELGQAAAAADPARSASALAELYGMSAGALLQWASDALIPPSTKRERS
jgi:magnesium transporter